MFHRIAKNLRLLVAWLAGPALLLVVTPASAQVPAPVSPAQFDPSDVYFQGWMTAREGEKLEADGDFIKAAEKLKKARELFETVRHYYPSWKSEMVAGRSTQNSEAEIRVHPKAEEQRRKNQNVVAELEGGVKKNGTLAEPAPGMARVAPGKAQGSTHIDPAQGVVPLTPGILEVDPLATRRLAEAEAEVKRLRDLLKKANTYNSQEASRDASRVIDLTRQRDLAQEQLHAAENTVQSLRAKLAVNPVENELKLLNQRIAGLEQEREAMANALTQSRSAHTDALSRIDILQADLKVMQQKHAAMQQKQADLDRDLKAERNVANSVVTGQRSQLQALEKELNQKNMELGKANERISGLINELQESRDAFAQLRTERDSLLQERDQMSATLKLNADGRIQDLVQQNIGLVKNLREANEKLERLSLDNNSTKDDITAALRDLAIAKSQINKLQQERREQDSRLQEFEKRLKSEESALSKAQVPSNPEEVATLRDIIQRQLRVQERRRQARDLLVETVKDMGAKDERIAQAIKLFDGQEIQLTTDEQRLIADRQVNGEFVSPFAQDRAIVGRNTSELNRDIAVYERTAEKSFAAGRFLPTRELFQMIVEQHPGHIPALCKLGVVNLKLKDPSAAVDNFRRAVELNENNPYAQRMLGFSLMSMGDLAAAEKNVQRAVELAPDDAKSQLLLGIIYDRLGRTREAESCYKAAITADPVASDPYYNLARLCSLNGKRLEDAKSYYNQAIEHGAAPDPNLEQRLAQQ